MKVDGGDYLHIEMVIDIPGDKFVNRDPVVWKLGGKYCTEGTRPQGVGSIVEEAINDITDLLSDRLAQIGIPYGG